MANVYDQFDDQPSSAEAASDTPVEITIPGKGAAPRQGGNVYDQFDNGQTPPVDTGPEAEADPVAAFGGHLLPGAMRALANTPEALVASGERGYSLLTDKGRKAFDTEKNPILKALGGAGIWGLGTIEPIISSFQGRPSAGQTGVYTQQAHDRMQDLLNTFNINPDEAFPQPTGYWGQIGEQAGAFLPYAITSHNPVAGLAGAGAMGTVSGVAMGAVPDVYKPAAGALGAILGGGALAVGSHVAGKGAKAVGSYFNPETEAARRAAAAATNRGAAVQNLSQPDTIPGYHPTADVKARDAGLMSLMRTLRDTNGDFNNRINERLAQNSAAQINHMKSFTEADARPMDVVDFIKGRMQLLDERMQVLTDAEAAHKRHLDASMGDPTAAEAGKRFRTALAAEQKRVKAETDALWKTIDRDGNTVLVTDPLMRVHQDIYRDMTPEARLGMSDGEKRIASIIENYGPTIPFRNFQDLRSEITEQMRTANRAGSTKAAGRLTALRGAMEDAVAQTAARRVLEDQQAVANGALAPDQALGAQFLKEAQDFAAADRTAQTGAQPAPGDAGAPAAPAPAVPRPTGAEGPPAGEPPRAPGDQGLPPNAGAGWHTVETADGRTIRVKGVRTATGELGMLRPADGDRSGFVPQSIAPDDPRRSMTTVEALERQFPGAKITPDEPSFGQAAPPGAAASPATQTGAGEAPAAPGDRFVGGLSIQQSAETQGRDFVPADRDMAALEKRLDAAARMGAPKGLPLNVKALSTEGRYGGVERSVDLEVQGKAFNPQPLWTRMLQEAQTAKQDSVFLAKEVPSASFDPVKHRPAIELTFDSPIGRDRLDAELQKLANNGMEFLTVKVEGKPATPGAMPTATGVRLIYMPEIERRYGFGAEGLDGLDDAGLADHMRGKARELNNLIARVSAGVPGVRGTVKWYDVDTAFGTEYGERLGSGIETGLPQAGGRPATGRVWRGQSVREGLAAADRHVQRLAGDDQRVRPDAARAAGEAAQERAAPVGDLVAERFVAAGRSRDEADANGAIAQDFADGMVAAYGVTPDQVRAVFDAPEVRRAAEGEGSEPGALFQRSWRNQEYHPATAFMDQFDYDTSTGANTTLTTGVGPKLHDLLQRAWNEADRNPNNIPLQIDNTPELYGEAKKLLTDNFPNAADVIEEQGGVGNAIRLLAQQLAPSAEDWRAKFGEPLVPVNKTALTVLPKAPTFYSGAAKSLETIKLDKAPGATWWNKLASSGASKDELKWLEIEPWLKEQKGSVTKEQVNQFIRDHQIEVRDVVLGGKHRHEQEYDEDADPMNDLEVYVRDAETQEPDDEYISDEASDLIDNDPEYMRTGREDALDKLQRESSRRVVAYQNDLAGRRAETDPYAEEPEFKPEHFDALRNLYEENGWDDTELPGVGTHPDMFGGDTEITDPRQGLDPQLVALKQQVEELAKEKAQERAEEDARENYYDGDPPQHASIRVSMPDGSRRDYSVDWNGYGGGAEVYDENGNNIASLARGEHYNDNIEQAIRDHLRNEIEGEREAARQAAEAARAAAEAAGGRQPIKYAGRPAYPNYAEKGGEDYFELLLDMPSLGGVWRNLIHGGFTPHAPNALVHVRADTRMIGNERTLMLHEVQADGHQKGQTYGYATHEEKRAAADAQEKAQEAYRNAEAALVGRMTNGRYGSFYGLQRAAHGQARELNDLEAAVKRFQTYNDNYAREAASAVREELRAYYQREIARYEGYIADGEKRIAEIRAEIESTGDLQKLANEVESAMSSDPEIAAAQQAARGAEEAYMKISNAVPPAPFSGTSEWAGLAMKRMIRWAAEHGYDQIAWSPGDLENGSTISHLLTRVIYRKNEDGTYWARAKAGRYDDTVVAEDAASIEALRRKLPKDVVDQIEADSGEITDRTRSYGESVKEVGPKVPVRVGSKLAYYYGKLLPDVVNKLAKRFDKDAKVGTATTRLNGEDMQVLTLPITDKLRDGALNVGFSMFNQGERGSILFGDAGKSIISLFMHADASTGLHELGHQFLRSFRALAEGDGAPALLRNDWETVKNWWDKNADAVARDAGGGVNAEHVRQVLKDGTTGNADLDGAINRGMHEQWARAFERYVREGVAPTAGLKRVFEQFKDWLTKIYKSVTDLNVDLSPEMRSVFDRMLGGKGERGEFMSPETAKTYLKATGATKAMKETFGKRSVSDLLRRPGAAYPYDMPDEAVAASLWRPGQPGGTSIRERLKAAGNTPEARAAIEDAAVLSLRSSAMKDGVLDANKLQTWRERHAAALGEMPDLHRRLGSVNTTLKAMEDNALRRAEVAKQAKNSVAAKLMGLSADADVVKAVGNIIKGQGAVSKMRALVAETKGDPVALDGLRSAVYQHLIDTLSHNQGGLKSDAFQTYIRTRAPVLREVLTPENMEALNAISAELQASAKNYQSGTGARTAEALNRQAEHGGSKSLLGTILGLAFRHTARHATAGAAGWAGYHLSGGNPLAAIAAAGGTEIVTGFRAAGLRKVEDVLMRAFEDPVFMKRLLMKAPRDLSKGSWRALLKRLVKIGVVGTAVPALQTQAQSE